MPDVAPFLICGEWGSHWGQGGEGNAARGYRARSHVSSIEVGQGPVTGLATITRGEEKALGCFGNGKLWKCSGNDVFRIRPGIGLTGEAGGESGSSGETRLEFRNDRIAEGESLLHHHRGSAIGSSTYFVSEP